MWAALHNAYEEDSSILNGKRLAELDETDIKELFSADNDVELPQLEDRRTILNSIGEQLSEEYDGSFHKLVERSDKRLYSDGNGLIDNITDFETYNDSVRVDGNEIDFYKRAQLAVWMPLGHLEVTGTENPLKVEDEENFEIAADYHFPNIFRHLGLHEYDEELVNDIEAGNELDGGGRREAELRAAAVYHGRNLINELDSRTDEEVTAAGLDGALFTDYKEEAENDHEIHRVDHTIWY
ncbi:MAG: hypothetical protein BRC29_03325 [Nanohaloarchaea archaeon SW_7_43_1]|nr:MAG: hypothetical protein BRC29_03325 [Nanohaloarchaea archaeon SW_7_43_1]